MYSPKYNISNAVLKNIGIIDACREVIENAPLVPAYEKKFREEAIIRTVHHGTHIEGNDLSLTQAEQVIVGAPAEVSVGKVVEKTGLTARERDIQEVINYRNVMDYLGRQFNKSNGSADVYAYTDLQIKQIHQFTVDKVVPEEKQGIYRKTQVVLKDSRTGEVTFRPPPAVEVPYLIEDFVTWINSPSSLEIHPVLKAGIAHYALAAIHPFVDGNGRAARAFATLVLYVEGYDIRQLFSLEEYFDRDSETYYQTLIDTSQQSNELAERDLTTWLEYFTTGLAIELAKIKDKVRKLSVDSKIKLERGEQIMLSDRQMKIVEFLSENGKARMVELRELFPQYSEDTVLRDLQMMAKRGIMKKKGRTKGSYYELVTN